MPRKGESILASAKDEVIALYRAGSSLQECGAAFGVTSTCVRTLLRQNGIPLRSPKDGVQLHWNKAQATGHPRCVRGSKFDGDIGEMIRLYREGKTSVEIGERFGTSSVQVRWLLRRAGVGVRSKGDALALMWTEGVRSGEKRTADPGPYRHIPTVEPLQQAELPLTSPDEPLYYCRDCDRMVPQSGWAYHARPQAKDKRVKRRCKACIAEHAKRPESRAITDKSKAKHRDKNREVNRLAYEILRDEIISAYGGECGCCSVSHREFLAVDHSLGGGTRHRLHLRKNGMGGGWAFYKWLADNSCPPEFRLLCHNCNSSHGYYGYCPHKECRPFALAWEHLQGKDRQVAKLRADRRQIRLDLIRGYGGRCACCGETAPEFLALDHVNGGGAEHRRRLKAEGIAMYTFYRSLIEQGFPIGFRLLCHNCNWACGQTGICPHVDPAAVK